MDVVRITQALRQQSQTARLSPTRGGTNTLSSATESTQNEAVSIRRGNWDSSLTLNTSALAQGNTHYMEQDSTTTPTSAAPSSASPLSSFFSLPSSFSLSSFLPSSATEGSSFFTGGSSAAAAAAATSGPSNMGEIESLLLRSMPMFGNLVSRD
ncbi:hypothetical protein BC939DRAFT_435052 [Gamsiella multidivaricata]|uniref:uncharacterized protein n=1 Tax=Gamsiella multidivaricata TaxID=101098 RepID=UPI00222065DB|nr:uncharacterized protein BC939DRAFT_435052 [Gamsiella multidivaricata]KAG0368477.1 hypothetical protein BGZ54_001843 [Gamsiella multidivaricata]KAI7832270.1 hypothetical protein BC939DRAFT_435052 [Gamsiella multidivaricata]